MVIGTHCGPNSEEEPECRADDFAVAWILVGAALEADNGEGEAVHD